MTLTEFLLARIAEDEAAAHRMRHFEVEDIYYSCPATRDPADAGDLDTGEENCDCGMPQRRARDLAECEAKRRIIEAYGTGWHLDVAPPWPSGGEPSEWDALGWALLVLASVYADHPDYDEKWKP